MQAGEAEPLLLAGRFRSAHGAVDLTGEKCVVCSNVSSIWEKGDNCDHHACGNCFKDLYYGTNMCPACPSQLVIFSKKERTPDKIQHPLECMYCYDTLTDVESIKGNADGCGHSMCRTCFDKFVTNGESNYCMFCNPSRSKDGVKFWITPTVNDGEEQYDEDEEIAPIVNGHDVEFEVNVMETQCAICRDVLSTVQWTTRGQNCDHEFCEGFCYNGLVGSTNRCPLCQARLENRYA